MIKLTCLPFIYLNVCNRVCNNVYAHAIAQRCVRYFFWVVLFSCQKLPLIVAEEWGCSNLPSRLPWNLFYKFHSLIWIFILLLKVIPCTIYLNLSKDTKFWSRRLYKTGRLWEYGYSQYTSQSTELYFIFMFSASHRIFIYNNWSIHHK